MKYIDAEKLIAEIKQQRSLIEGLFLEGDNSFYEGVDNICCHFLEVINSLQQEHREESDKSLEEAADEYEKGYYDVCSAAKRAEEKAVEYQIKTHGPNVMGGANILSEDEYMRFNMNYDFKAGYEEGEKDMAERAIEWLEYAKESGMTFDGTIKYFKAIMEEEK